MYAEVDDDGNRLHTMNEVAETFNVSRATLYRQLGRTDAAAATARTPA